ncbi:uncharacterized protein LOC100904012 [Galendromus occidentalis]|uniref:Uncharacterized protein LOC100904012 n=1 Tax=Galendromus occidentalis TaxID=34638 RepID=A0AAJ6QLZ9_9ACAR|nr:uncharacterized protein LOC100904012 [Galendromus occidentalis]
MSPDRQYFSCLKAAGLIGLLRSSEPVLIASIVLEGLSLMLFPSAKFLWLAHIASVVSGVTAVTFEACSYVALANLWEKPALALHIYQLGYGLATFIISIIVEPFLSASDVIEHGKLQHSATSVSRIYIPYVGVGLLSISVGIGLAILSLVTSMQLETKAGAKPENEGVPGETQDQKRRHGIFEICLISLLTLFLVFFDSLATAVHGWVEDSSVPLASVADSSFAANRG